MLLSIHALSRTAAAVLTAAACTVSPSPAARASASSAAPSGTPAANVRDVVSASAHPDSVDPMSDQPQSSFHRMLTQKSSGFDEPAELVIRNRAALESAWARLFDQVQGNPAPAVDFTRETVLLVALGRRSSGGYAVRVDAVTRRGESAVVRYTVTSPGPGCMSTQALTSPVEVVRTTRLSGAVRFARRDLEQRC